MTRKDFELIASVLKATRNDITIADKDALVRAMAFRLADTNKQFNRDKFIRACGVCP